MKDATDKGFTNDEPTMKVHNRQEIKRTKEEIEAMTVTVANGTIRATINRDPTNLDDFKVKTSVLGTNDPVVRLITTNLRGTPGRFGK